MCIQIKIERVTMLLSLPGLLNWSGSVPMAGGEMGYLQSLICIRKDLIFNILSSEKKRATFPSTM